MYKYKSLQAGELPQDLFLNFIILKYLKQEVDEDLNCLHG